MRPRFAAGWLWGPRACSGHDSMDVIAEAGQDVVGLDLPDIDISSPESVASALDAICPDVVVNAAACTAVDEAERNERLALLVSGEGPHPCHE